MSKRALSWQENVQAFIAGGGAGAASKTFVAPLERLKTLVQVERLRPKPRSIFQIVKDVWNLEGFIGFYKGNGANCIRIIPNKGILYMANNFYVNLLKSPTETERNFSSLKRLTAGSLSGATLISIIYPLDYVQTLLASGAYDGIIECMTSTVKEEGFRGLYKGYFPALLGIVPMTGTMFWSYDMLKHYATQGGPLTDSQSILFGAISGAFSQTVSYPLDTVRKRIAVQNKISVRKIYTGTLDAIRHIWKAEGIKGFYGGVWINAVRAAPSQAIQFWSYGFIMKLIGGRDVISG